MVVQVLHLDRNNIGDDGAVALASSLKRNTASRVVALMMKDNSVSDVGALALLDALESSPR